MLALLTSLILGGMAQADPEEAEIAAYLEQTLPSHFDVHDLAFRIFPAGNGTGRVSIAGHLALVEDIYVPVRDDAGIAETFAEEHNEDDVRYAKAELPKRTIYKVVYIPDPTGFPFSAELNYQEQVNGTAFSGRANHQQLGQYERTAATLPANSVVVASPAFDQYVQDIERRLAALRRYREQARAAVAPLLTAGTATVAQDVTGERFDLRFQLSQGMSWEPRDPRRIHFGADATIIWPETGRLYNTRYDTGDEGPAYLRFDYLPRNNGTDGRLSITLSIYDEASGGWYRSDGATYRPETDMVFRSPRGMSHGRRMAIGE